jgi:hypothetical protein
LWNKFLPFRKAARDTISEVTLQLLKSAVARCCYAASRGPVAAFEGPYDA